MSQHEQNVSETEVNNELVEDDAVIDASDNAVDESTEETVQTTIAPPKTMNNISVLVTYWGHSGDCPWPGKYRMQRGRAPVVFADDETEMNEKLSDLLQ